MADSPPTPPTTRSSTTTRSQALKPRANVQRKAKAETDKFLQQEAERSKLRVEKGTRGAAAKRGRGGARGGASTGPGLGDKDSTDASARDSRLRGDIDTSGVFGAGLGVKAKAKGKAGSEGVAEWVGGDPEPKDENGDLAAVSGGGQGTEKEKGKTKKVTAVKGKEKAGARGVVIEDFGAQGSADAHVSLQVVPNVSEDDEPDEETRDIEKIWLSSDEDEEAKHRDEDEEMEDEYIIDRTAKRRASTQRQKPPGGGGGLRPVRAPRIILPPKEEVDPSAQTRKHSKASAPRSKGLASASAPDFIDIDEMDIDDEVEFIKEVPSSPDVKRKNAKKAPGKGKDVKFSTETVEERAERLRGLEDLSKLRQIFTPVREGEGEGRNAKGKGKGKEKEGEAEQGRLFLMQFPPLTPFLVDPSAPQAMDGGEDVQEINAEGHASRNTQQQSSTAKPPAPAAMGTATIKKDPDAHPPPFHPKSSAINAAAAAEGTLTASSSNHLPSGYVGKLNVHASGKITLDWGGCDMEVRLGTDVGFLQDAIVIDDRPMEATEVGAAEEDADGEGAAGGQDENGEHERDRTTGKEKGNVRGTVYALGQIQGKMVVVPDWARLYD